MTMNVTVDLKITTTCSICKTKIKRKKIYCCIDLKNKTIKEIEKNFTVICCQCKK